MHLTFLGTGSAMPTGRRFQTGLLLETENNALLVDCGSGVLHNLANTDVGYEGVDTVLLTHHHLDHVSDLMVLLKARWLAGETTMRVAGPPGTESLVRGLLDVHEYMNDRIEFTFVDVQPDEGQTQSTFELAGFEISAMETRHSMPCLAYRFETPQSDSDPIVFSGDTEAFDELLEFADGAAVLIHDCSFPDDVDVSNHPTPTKLGKVLSRVEPDIGCLYLTHLYPHTEGREEEMLESIRTYYEGTVRFASDGLTHGPV